MLILESLRKKAQAMRERIEPAPYPPLSEMKESIKMRLIEMKQDDPKTCSPEEINHWEIEEIEHFYSNYCERA